MRDEQGDKLKEIKHNDLSKTLKIEADELIKKEPMFSQLAEKERDRLANLLRAKTIPRGRFLTREGEKDDSLFLIARGIAKVERAQNGDMERLATLYAGDFFGEGALPRGEPSIKKQIISIDHEP